MTETEVLTWLVWYQPPSHSAQPSRGCGKRAPALLGRRRLQRVGTVSSATPCSQNLCVRVGVLVSCAPELPHGPPVAEARLGAPRADEGSPASAVLVEPQGEERVALWYDSLLYPVSA